MKLRPVTLIWALLAACVFVPGASPSLADDGRFVLVADGKSNAEIVMQSGSVAMVRYAAEEFRDYVHKISGADLSIEEVGPDYQVPADGKLRVFIGESAYTRKLGLDPTKLKSDGYYVAITPESLVLVGRDEPVPYIENKSASGRYEMMANTEAKLCGTGQTGSLYAVYQFLEKYCDARWYWPGELGEVIPRSSNISAPIGQYSVEPSFELRMYSAFNFATDIDAAKWYRRAGFGATTDPAQPNHSAYLIYGKEENHKLHPEWFAIHKGKRDYADLCWTEPTLVVEWVRLAKEYFTKNPSAMMFPVMPEDGTGVCECPRCQKLVDWSAPVEGVGSLGGNQLLGNLLWPVVNEVARQIKTEFPDKFVGCCAYSTYLKPAWMVEKMEPNVCVMLCAMTPFMFDPAYDQGMAAFEQGWLGKGTKIYSTWDYVNAHLFLTGNNGSYTPYIIPHMLSKRYSRLKGISRGCFFEAENAPGWGMSKLTHYGMDHVNWYVMGKLSWDPALDVDALLDDYCKHFYGPAASSMRKFWQVQEDQWSSRKDPLVWDGVCTSRWNHVYTPNVLREMFRTLDDARATAAKSDDPNYARRIDLISGEYAILRSCLVDNWKTRKISSKLVNGSFEMRESDAARNWYYGDGVIDVAGLSLSGKKSLRMSGSEAYAASSVVALDPNKDYMISVWFKTEGNGNPDVEPAWPKLSVLTVADSKTTPAPMGSPAPGKVTGTSEAAFAVSRPGNCADWQRMYVICKPGAFAQLRLRGAQGYTCWYDDVMLEELPDGWQRSAVGFPSYP